MVSFVHVTSLVSVKNRFQTNLVDKDHFQQIFENLVLIHSKYNRIELFTITTDKVCMYEEMMTNTDNVESSLLTSNLLKICSLYNFCYKLHM